MIGCFHEKRGIEGPIFKIAINCKRVFYTHTQNFERPENEVFFLLSRLLVHVEYDNHLFYLLIFQTKRSSK